MGKNFDVVKDKLIIVVESILFIASIDKTSESQK